MDTVVEILFYLSAIPAAFVAFVLLTALVSWLDL